MKLLFLDDMPQRWHTFTAAMPEEYLKNCYYAETYAEAVALVEKNGPDYFTHYFLDHDLGPDDYEQVTESGEHYGPILETSNNGSKFAVWMVENKVRADVIVCHSMNPYGRDNMQNILKGGGCANTMHAAPFAWQFPERFI